MIDNQKFIDLARQTSTGQRTGKLYAYTRDGGKLSFATLFFIQGQLSGCEYSDKTGNQALSGLIDSQITNVVFVAGDGLDYIKDPSIWNVEALLSSTKPQLIEKIQPSIETSEFKDVAIDALKAICGDSATKLVNDLAERYPPEKNQDKFIEECVKLASGFVGAEIANNILKPLLAIRN